MMIRFTSGLIQSNSNFLKTRCAGARLFGCLTMRQKWLAVSFHRPCLRYQARAKRIRQSLRQVSEKSG